MMITVQMTALVLAVFTVFVSLSTIYVVDGKRADTKRNLINKTCRAMTWFDKRQKKVCVRLPSMISQIQKGVENALVECRRLFSSRRWNCVPLTWTQVFKEGGILKKRSTETAFVQALSAAGVMHQISKACARGDLNACGCGTVVAKKRRNNKKWMWGGCGDNIRYGSSITKHFMDQKKITNHARKTKVHNHEVGRKIVRDNFVRKCKCHGKSESCTVKTCWRIVPSMEKISNELWKRYENPVESRWIPKQKTLIDRTKSRKNKKNFRVPADKLSFFEASEDFCQANLSMGIMGTSGRTCNHTSNDHDGCSTMCCGRKYKTTQVTKKIKCKCEFVWCCKIVCKTCRKTEIIDTCL